MEVIFRGLIGNAEASDGFDLVTKELNTDWVKKRDGIDIEDVAARGELEGMLNLINPLIAHLNEFLFKFR